MLYKLLVLYKVNNIIESECMIGFLIVMEDIQLELLWECT